MEWVYVTAEDLKKKILLCSYMRKRKSKIKEVKIWEYRLDNLYERRSKINFYSLVWRKLFQIINDKIDDFLAAIKYSKVI